MNKNVIRWAVVSTLVFAGAQAATYDSALWNGMRYRMIGSERGGSVTTVTGVPSQPYTFYMGSTGGGVSKTADAGHIWVNVSDGFFAAASIGAVEVSLSDQNRVYTGTGSSKIRGNTHKRGLLRTIVERARSCMKLPGTYVLFFEQASRPDPFANLGPLRRPAK